MLKTTDLDDQMRRLWSISLFYTPARQGYDIGEFNSNCNMCWYSSQLALAAALPGLIDSSQANVNQRHLDIIIGTNQCLHHYVSNNNTSYYRNCPGNECKYINILNCIGSIAAHVYVLAQVQFMEAYILEFLDKKVRSFVSRECSQ